MVCAAKTSQNYRLVQMLLFQLLLLVSLMLLQQLSLEMKLQMLLKSLQSKNFGANFWAPDSLQVGNLEILKTNPLF